MQRISVQGVSGSGKSTFACALAGRLGVPCVELDAIVHGPNWADRSAEEVHAAIAPVLAQEAWVMDGRYRNLLGDTVFARADTVVWLDLPIRVWLPRLAVRTFVRMVRREELWNGNRERLRNLFDRPNIFQWAWQKHFGDRKELPAWVARHPHLTLVRLRSPKDVRSFLASL